MPAITIIHVCNSRNSSLIYRVIHNFIQVICTCMYMYSRGCYGTINDNSRPNKGLRLFLSSALTNMSSSWHQSKEVPTLSVLYTIIRNGPTGADAVYSR